MVMICGALCRSFGRGVLARRASAGEPLFRDASLLRHVSAVRRNEPAFSTSATPPEPAERTATAGTTATSLYGHASFIDGETITPPSPPSSCATFAVTNPSTGAAIAHLACASDACVDAAVSSSARAFATSWRRSSHAARDAFLVRWRGAIAAHRDALAQLLVLETGKALREAEAELDVGLSFIDWSVGAAARALGSSTAHPRRGEMDLVARAPVGVCLLVTPWNFPVSLLVRKVAMAVAAGCTAVVKPSDRTPLTALALARLAYAAPNNSKGEAGSEGAAVPPGLLNVVVADGARAARVVDRALDADAVRLVAFTGSTEVGKKIAQSASRRVVRTLLELGGHAAAVVFDDADVDAAADAIVAGKIRNAGQACVSVNRVFVQRGGSGGGSAGRYDAVVEALAARMRAVRVGDGLAPGVEMGPLIDAGGVERARRHVGDAVSRGARLLLGGDVVSSPSFAAIANEEGNGATAAEEQEEVKNLFAPTVLADVSDEMLVAREETFAPVLPVLPFDAEDEAVRRANALPHGGLAAYVFTRDVGRAMRVAQDLEVGMVGVNEVRLTTAATPFGGVKESGIGREGGAYSLEAFTEEKFIKLRHS